MTKSSKLASSFGFSYSIGDNVLTFKTHALKRTISQAFETIYISP